MIKLKFEVNPDVCSSPYGVSYPVGSNVPAAIEWAKKAALMFKTIEEYKERPLNLFCRGGSGVILATLFASNLPEYRVKVCHIKKPGELSHNDTPYIEISGVNIIIDDFIACGTTVEAIAEKMNDMKCTPEVIVISNAAERVVNYLNLRYSISVC
jgi:hypothetical protein